jgi:hypothetical protein
VYSQNALMSASVTAYVMLIGSPPQTMPTKYPDDVRQTPAPLSPGSQASANSLLLRGTAGGLLIAPA